MEVQVSEWVPSDKFGQFHEILCATGGRYLRDPQRCGDRVRVEYETSRYEAHCDAWRRSVTDIVEVRRDQWWRRLLRRSSLAVASWLR